MGIGDCGLRELLADKLRLRRKAGREAKSVDEVRRPGFGGGVFEVGGTGRAECAEGGDEGGVAACADGGPSGGAGGADEGGKPVAGEGANDGGVGVAGAESEAAGRGGEVEGEESEGEAESCDQEADGGGEAEAIKDQAREGELEGRVGLRLR